MNCQSYDHGNYMVRKEKKVFLIGKATLATFGISGLAIIVFFQKKSLLTLFLEGESPYMQLAAGGLVGLVSAILALTLINSTFFAKEKQFYVRIIDSFDLNISGVIFLSWCAGIGEEIFFRGAIQPYPDIFWTSLLFVFIHGYLNPKKLRLTAYGLVLTGIIVVFGLLFERIGLLATISAHAVFDMVLLYKLILGTDQQLDAES